MGSQGGQKHFCEWPVGVETNGNEGVSEAIRNTPGALGYIELSYAQKDKLAFGSVQNAWFIHFGRRQIDRRCGQVPKTDPSRLSCVYQQCGRQERLSNCEFFVDFGRYTTKKS